MTYRFPGDIAKLLREQMATGRYACEDDILREALRALAEFVHSPAEFDEEYCQTVAAVREGLADAEAGRTRPLRALIDEADCNRKREAP